VSALRDWILKPYNSSIKPKETMQWDKLQFSSGGSALKMEKWMWKFKTACTTILRLVANSLQHIYKKWVEHFKKCIGCQGGCFEKETITALPQSLTWSNKVNPRTFQIALVDWLSATLHTHHNVCTKGWINYHQSVKKVEWHNFTLFWGWPLIYTEPTYCQLQLIRANEGCKMHE
jgi:hypothetical protein